jgi:RNA polymerase sigma factor (sigma-70 family)
MRAGARHATIALNVVLMHKPVRRPARGEIDEAALELLARHGSQILATARRYAATFEDAEDAYQRGLEILLTKAPTTREEELVPWLKTVVKHEAFALRRQRDRHAPVTDDGELRDRSTAAAATHDQAERLERLSQGAEALRQLKPHEMRALLLKGEGYSYAEICQITGWSYTKVNRCLTEGRQALAVRLAGIQGGVECGKLAPLLSALADGEARADDVARLRLHMKTCLACRARLREFRDAPAHVAALVPPVALVGTGGAGGGALRQLLESLLGTAQHKAAALGERAHAAAELAGAQKVAAVAASAAALAGGGTAVDRLANHEPHRPGGEERRLRAEPVKEEVAVDPAPAPGPPQAPAPDEPSATEAAPAPAPSSAPAPSPPPPQPPSPANEFDPVAATAGPGAAPAPTSAPAPGATAGAGAAPNGDPGGGGGSGGGGPGGAGGPSGAGSPSGAGGEFAP